MFWQKKHQINIGGGPDFHHSGWINIDSVASEANPNPVTLDANTIFPLRKRSVTLAYSSHALEHMNDATVDRVLEEIKRCLMSNGDVVIKIPDFDAVLAAWRAKDSDFFSDEKWSYGSITWSWASKGVKDSLTSRASILFAGFWNKDYGSHFARQVNRTPTSYHGPAVCEEETVEQWLSKYSPHEIARLLVEHIQDSESEIFFNHQNAWSLAEFAELLKRRGFTLVTADKENICSRFAKIPGIREMFSVSLYMHAKLSG